MPDTGAVKRPVARFNPVPRRKAPLARGCKIRRAEAEQVPSTLNNYFCPWQGTSLHAWAESWKNLQDSCLISPEHTFQMGALAAFDASKTQNDQYETWRCPFCSLPNSSNSSWLRLCSLHPHALPVLVVSSLHWHSDIQTSHYLGQEVPTTPKDFPDGAKQCPQVKNLEPFTLLLRHKHRGNTHMGLQRFSTQFRSKSDGFDTVKEQVLGFLHIPYLVSFCSSLGF